MLYTILPLHLLNLGATAAQVGLVFTVGMVFVSILQFFGGWISDHIGRLRTIAIGSGIATLGYLGFWLAPTWIWILPAICFEFVSIAMVGPSFSALIADQSTNETRGKTFGIMRGVLMLVTILGPLLGGLIAQEQNFQVVLATGFVLYLSASVLRVWLVWKYPAPPRLLGNQAALPSLKSTLKSILGLVFGGGILTWILITDGGRDLAFNLSSDLLPVFLSTALGLNALQVGLFRALRGWATVLSTLAAGWLSDQLSERRVIIAGFVLEAAGLIAMILARDMTSLIPAALLFGAGLGMLFPAFDSLISKAIPENMRGTAYGLFDSNRSLLAIPGPAIGGQLMEHGNPALPFLITAGMNLAWAWIAWFKLKITPDSPSASQSGRGS